MPKVNINKFSRSKIPDDDDLVPVVEIKEKKTRAKKQKQVQLELEPEPEPEREPEPEPEHDFERRSNKSKFIPFKRKINRIRTINTSLCIWKKTKTIKF